MEPKAMVEVEVGWADKAVAKVVRVMVAGGKVEGAVAKEAVAGLDWVGTVVASLAGAKWAKERSGAAERAEAEMVGVVQAVEVLEAVAWGEEVMARGCSVAEGAAVPAEGSLEKEEVVMVREIVAAEPSEAEIWVGGGTGKG